MTQSFEGGLLAQIQRLVVSPGQQALWSLGQAGFAIKGGETIAYIDPYLSDAVAASGGPARRFPIPIDPGTIQHADVIFATHEHRDHADGATLGPLLAASQQATLVTSQEGREIARQAGVSTDRIVVPRLGVRVSHGALTYTAVRLHTTPTRWTAQVTPAGWAF